MKAADASLAAAQKQINSTEASAVALAKSLDEIKISNAKMMDAKRNLQIMQDALGDTRGCAISTSAALADVFLGPGQASLTAINARSEVHSLHEVRNAALEAAAAIGMLGPGPIRLMLGPGSARSMSQSMSSWARAAERTDRGTFIRSLSAAMREASVDQPRDEHGKFIRSMSSAMGDIDAITARGPGGKFVSDTEAAAISAKRLADALEDARHAVEVFVAEEMGSRLRLSPSGRVRDQGPYFGNLIRPIEVPPGGFGGGRYGGVEPVDYHGGADLLPYAFTKAANDLLVADRIFANDLANRYQIYTPGMGPLTREQYLAQNATPLADRPVVPIGYGDQGEYERYDFPVDPAVKAARRLAVSNAKQYLRRNNINWDDNALGGMGGVRRDPALDTAALLGITGRGGTWHRSRIASAFGLAIPVPPHGGIGSPLALAGFGIDRMLATTIGILGSFGGGILGGGLLGAGALGTMAVGAGTNLAGVGQAAGDIKTVSSDLSKLQTAIQQYGKNSTQAAAAQLQLNTDLKGFSPVARNAVLAAAQTSQGFKAMFDKLTGQAEKTGAEIINQAMQVGEKFLPTIGKFAAQNMKILQHGLQPFFSWLTKGGDAQNVIRDVNSLNKAVKEHGATSIQAVQAREQLAKDNRNTGGLAYFKDLEKIYQKNFPTAIHAGEQGFELLVKTIDLAAQHLGHFLAKVDHFFTRMNHQDFGQWAAGVEKLIGLFHSWLGMFVSFGRVIFDVFKPAVGLGKAFADGMTHMFSALHKYLTQSGTQDILHKLFGAHLVQLIHQIGGLIMNLLPIIEKMISAWLQIEVVVVRASGYLIDAIKGIVGWFNKIPGADKILGWALALGLIVKVNRLLLGSFLPILRTIPFIGGMFGKTASESTAAVGRITEVVNVAATSMVTAVDRVSLAVANLGRQFMGLGPLAEDGAIQVDAALATEAGMASRVGSRALGAVGLGGLMGTGLKSVAMRGGMAAITGVIAGQLIQSFVPGKTGSILGNVAKGAGIGAGIGMFVGMPEVGAAIGGVTGALVSLIHVAPSAGDQLVKLGSDYRALGHAAKNAKLGIAQARGQVTQDRQLRTEAQHQVDVARQHVRAAHGARAQAKATQELRIALGNLASIDGRIIQDEKILTGQRQANNKAMKAQKETQAGMVKSITSLEQASQKWATVFQPITKDMDALSNRTSRSSASVNMFVQKMYQFAASIAATDPKLAQAMRSVAALTRAIHRMPSRKVINIIVRETFKGSTGLRVGPNGDLFPGRSFFGSGSGSGGGHHHRGSGATIHTALPRAIQDAITMAQAGHGNMLKAMKAAYEFYQRQLSQPGLSHKQRMKLYELEAQYYDQSFGKPTGYQHGGKPPKTKPGAVPTHYLDKQQAETARARIDINHGQYKAALKLLRLEDQQLHAMLATAKNQAERTAILNQIATVSGLIKSAKSQMTGISPDSYQIPMALQVAMAKADAIAALNPNLQGPTSQQYQLALKAKKAAMKAINSHHLTMQQLIDAWNVVGQANAVIAARLGVLADTYHAVSAKSIVDAVQGLTHLQKLALMERISQAQAHRGNAPNQSAVGGGGSAPASQHHRRRHHHRHGHDGGGGGGGGGGPRVPAASRSGGTTIHIDKVEVHGVQNVRQLAGEIEKLSRQKHQRAGGRR